MVEFENDRIGLAAIHARVRRQIIPDEILRRSLVDLAAIVNVLDVLSPVVLIPGLSLKTLASLARCPTQSP